MDIESDILAVKNYASGIEDQTIQDAIKRICSALEKVAKKLNDHDDKIFLNKG